MDRHRINFIPSLSFLLLAVFDDFRHYPSSPLPCPSSSSSSSASPFPSATFGLFLAVLSSATFCWVCNLVLNSASFPVLICLYLRMLWSPAYSLPLALPEAWNFTRPCPGTATHDVVLELLILVDVPLRYLTGHLYGPACVFALLEQSFKLDPLVVMWCTGTTSLVPGPPVLALLRPRHCPLPR